MWRRAVVSIGFSTTGKGWQNWQKAIFNRISEGTLETFLVRFRGVSVLHFTAMVLWCGGGLFSAPEAVERCRTGKGWQNLQKAIFNRVSVERTLDTFLVRFRCVSVLHCHGVLVRRRAVISTGFRTTGKGWQNWQKAIFNRVLVVWCALESSSVPWCFSGAGLACHRVHRHMRPLGCLCWT